MPASSSNKIKQRKASLHKPTRETARAVRRFVLVGRPARFTPAAIVTYAYAPEGIAGAAEPR
jgi:hypothetical protein